MKPIVIIVFMKPTNSSMVETNTYCYLYIAQWKTVYDQYGEDTLRIGIPDQDGIFRGGYVY